MELNRPISMVAKLRVMFARNFHEKNCDKLTRQSLMNVLRKTQKRTGFVLFNENRPDDKTFRIYLTPSHLPRFITAI